MFLSSRICLMLAGHSVTPFLPWTPVAYFWQDLLIALVFGAVDRLIKRPALAWTLYAILVAYSVINLPIAPISLFSADVDDDARGAWLLCSTR